MLPSITNVINLADSHDRAAFAMATHVKQEPRERDNSETKEEVAHKCHNALSEPGTYSSSENFPDREPENRFLFLLLSCGPW